MSADDQAFLDILSAVPNDVKKYTNEVADVLDKHLERLSFALRDHVPSSWLKTPPTIPPQSTAQKIASPSFYNNLQIFAKKNKKLLIFIAVFLGVTTYLVHKRRKAYGRKRRAKRAPNGARTEVVIIAGSQSDPLTKSLSLDLERRGFIVYVVCNTMEEEVLVQSERRADIKPLMLDITHPASTKATLDRFGLFFTTPQHAFPNARPHHLKLSSLIIIPSQSFASAPITSPSLTPAVWSDILNTRILYPIALIQNLLPLLRNSLQSSILVLTPSIISNLKAPYHAPESTVVSALEAFTETLRQELRIEGSHLPVVSIKLGNFDVSALVPHYNFQVTSTSTPRLRKLPTSNKVGSPLRELHNAVFDTIEFCSRTNSRWNFWRQPSVVRVGQGSTTYGFVGKAVPRGLVGWMMSLRSSPEDKVEGEDGNDKEDVYVRVYG